MKANDVIIFSDMDGTMITDWNMGPYVPTVNIDAIKRFVNAGGMFSIASGRQVHDTLNFFGGMKFSTPMVLSNGALIYDCVGEQILKKTGLPEPIKLECLDYFIRNEDVWLIAADEYDIYQVESGDAIRDASLNDLKRKHITTEDYRNFEPTKVCFVVKTVADQISVSRDIRNFKYADMICLTKSSPVILEIIEKRVGKAQGVKEAVRLAKAENRKVVCIGDYDNDCGMLALADIAACPSNASPCILEMAKIVTCSNNEGAVADLIRQLDVC